MNIVKRELKANLKSIIIWNVSMIFLILLWIVKFETFAGNPQINEFLESIPKAMLDGLGMSGINFDSLGGYVSALAFYLYLILGIHAVLLGSSTIAKEERDRTAEYLFSLPISRKKVVLSKTIAAIINMMVLNIVTLITTIISGIKHEKADDYYKFIVLLFIAIFIVQMIFLSIGMLVASINKKYKKSGNISVSILMIMFILATLINMVDKVDFLKYLTPFKYFDASYISEQLKIEPIFIVISILIIGVGIGGTLIIYPKRDLYI